MSHLYLRGLPQALSSLGYPIHLDNKPRTCSSNLPIAVLPFLMSTIRYEDIA